MAPPVSQRRRLHRRTSSRSNTDVAAALRQGGVRNGLLWLLLIVGALLLALLAVRWASDHVPGPPFFMVSGYVPEYRAAHVAAHLAHLAASVHELILFSVQPAADGSVSFAVGLSREQLGLAAQARAQGISSVLLSVGGAGRSQHFATVVASASKRRRLVNELLALCQEFGFSGVDLDWEAPASPAEVQGYSQLMQDLKHVFSQHTLHVTAAIHHWQDFGAAATLALDRIHIMAYDLPGMHSTLDHAKKIVHHLHIAGMPHAKMILVRFLFFFSFLFFWRGGSGGGRKEKEVKGKK